MGYSELALKGAEMFNRGVQKWCKASGKGFSVETLRPAIKKSDLVGLKYAPQLEGDVTHFSTKFDSLQQLPIISKEEALEICSQWKGLKAFNHTRQNVELEISGKKYIGQFIGGGGTKSAYKVTINDEEMCILLPSGGWGEALNEVANTKKLKDLGLLTNDYCQIIKVNADGQTIPALVSKPYDKHSFIMFDIKNPNTQLDEYIDVAQISEETLPSICSELVKDVKLLSKNNIALGCDSINLAFKDGKLRLYLNDLPYENLVDKSFSSEELAQEYLGNALDALQATYSNKAFRSNPLLEKLADIIDSEKIINDLLKLSDEELKMLGVGFSLQDTKFLLGLKNALHTAKNGNIKEADKIIKSL